MRSVKSVYQESVLWVATRPWVVGVAIAMMAPNADAYTCGSSSVGVFSSFTGMLGSVASFLNNGFGRAAVLIAIALMGLLMMFGELKGIFGTGMKILLGGSLVLMASQWAGVFSGFGGTSSACNFIQNG